MVLDIRNAAGIKDGLEYEITGMDVRAHASRVRGKMTWVIGGPVAIMKDVDLEAAPVDFKLIERFNQGPFPYPFAGQIIGRMRGRGGPLNRFMVDDLRMMFRDGNVPGAVAQGRASGMLDILEPANATFRGFTVTLDSFDLRTPQAINADFPLLRGTIAGTTVLDSSWLDVRFSGADLTHRDGELPESRFTGRGRITSGETEMAYDVDFEAQPLSMTTLAASFPAVPLRGDYSGRLKATGTLHDLLVVSDLSSEAGRIETDLRLDAEAPRYKMAGEARITAFDPQVAFDDLRMPSGELTAKFLADIAGDSLADLEGSASVLLDRSTLSGVRFFAGDARLRFTDGKVHLDTLHVETTALELDASGALGLHAGRTDSMTVRARADSLGGFRRWIATNVTDTLAGALRIDGIAKGWVRDFAFDGTLDGADLTRLDEDARAKLRGEKVGFIFQSFQLIPTLTAAENVQVPLELRGESDAAARALDLLKRVGLGDRGGLHRPGPHCPPEGGRRRLAGARQRRPARAARRGRPTPRHHPGRARLAPHRRGPDRHVDLGLARRPRRGLRTIAA